MTKFDSSDVLCLVQRRFTKRKYRTQKRTEKKERIYIQITYTFAHPLFLFGVPDGHSGHDTTIEDDVVFVERSRRTVLTTDNHVLTLSTSS